MRAACVLHERNGGFYDRCLECHRKEVARLAEALERVVAAARVCYQAAPSALERAAADLGPTLAAWDALGKEEA